MALAVDIRTARTGGDGSRDCGADQDVAAGLSHRGLVASDGDGLVRVVDVLVLGNGLVDGCLGSLYLPLILASRSRMIGTICGATCSR